MITICNLQFAGKFAAWQDKIDENDRFLTTMPNFHVDFQCSASIADIYVRCDAYHDRKIQRPAIFGIKIVLIGQR